MRILLWRGRTKRWTVTINLQAVATVGSTWLRRNFLNPVVTAIATIGTAWKRLNFLIGALTGPATIAVAYIRRRLWRPVLTAVATIATSWTKSSPTPAKASAWPMAFGDSSEDAHQQKEKRKKYLEEVRALMLAFLHPLRESRTVEPSVPSPPDVSQPVTITRPVFPTHLRWRGSGEIVPQYRLRTQADLEALLLFISVLEEEERAYSLTA